jgi:hypothetical protein
MGGDKLYREAKPLSLAEQAGKMGKYPQLKLAIKRNTAVWSGSWWPSILSDLYGLKITYRFPQRPRISIVSPILRLAQGQEKLPHVYEGGQSDICVHIREDWSSRLFIADTIMPWISQWIAFYETWAQTGVWLGEGTHPNLPQHRQEI